MSGAHQRCAECGSAASVRCFVTIDLSVVPHKKHVAAMRSAVLSLTNDAKSVRVTCPPPTPKKVCAQFSVPDARQEDFVDCIGRRFWMVEDYRDSSIGFSRRGNRRSRR